MLPTRALCVEVGCERVRNRLTEADAALLQRPYSGVGSSEYISLTAFTALAMDFSSVTSI